MKETNVPDPWKYNSEGNVPLLYIEDNKISNFANYTTVPNSPCNLTLSQPTTAGVWKIGCNFSISVSKRPTWLHRKMAKLLLGWTWCDA